MSRLALWGRYQAEHRHLVRFREVVEGVGLPEDVALAPVPGFDYQYAYINSVPVLVKPSTRRVEYIYR
jgi:hypothetical protein